MYVALIMSSEFHEDGIRDAIGPFETEAIAYRAIGNVVGKEWNGYAVRNGYVVELFKPEDDNDNV